jgi:flagellar biosynthesis protein FliQ
MSHVDHDPLPKNASHRHSYPSAFPDLWAPFFTSPLRGVPDSFATESGGLTLGFGYPIYERNKPIKDPSKHVFVFPTLLGFSLQSFSPPWWSKTPLRGPLSTLALGVQNLTGLASVLQRVTPTKKAVSLFAPKVLIWVVSFALLGFWVFQAFPLSGLMMDLLPPPFSPSSLPQQNLTILRQMDLGASRL